MRRTFRNSLQRKIPGLIGAMALLASLRAGAQTSAWNRVEIDARAPFVEPAPGDFLEGTAISSSGGTIGVNNRYLTLDGKPWLPVMGEFHYSRYPADRWEEQILKMKAAGVQIVSTYVIWIHHEEVEGQFDWSGQRDLRRFVELCGRHGMYVIVRIGPWSHAEVRNGGFPDWLLAKAREPRSNDPAYLSYVQKFDSEIGKQLRGLLWKDGGPVIGVQLENEYSSRGPGKGTEHILELKKMAIESGLDVPLYTVTGWDNAAIPEGAAIPVFGGYPDAPWDPSTRQLPPSEVYSFRFGNPATGNMGAIGAAGDIAQSDFRNNKYPFLTAELGGGIQDTYHRRPAVSADGIAAIVPVMLGSGANLYGIYMFQGGENPAGRLSTLQESQATGYPTDVPVKSYDFQAPLGEFGEERESLRKLKLFSYFLNDFGSYLAPMLVHAPASTLAADGKSALPRASARTAGDHGFLFVSDYLQDHSKSLEAPTQFTIRLPRETLRVPGAPVKIPAGAYFIWPFNLDLGSANLRYSTAQLFCRIDGGAGTDFFFAAVPGIIPQFAIDADGIEAIHAAPEEMIKRGTTIYISMKAIGFDKPVELRTISGRRMKLYVLDQQTAEDAWRVRIDGTDHLLITAEDFYADESAIHLLAPAKPDFAFTVFPKVDGLEGSERIDQLETRGAVSSFKADSSFHAPPLHYRKLRDAAEVPPVGFGPPLPWRAKGVAQAPDDKAFSRAAAWEIDLSRTEEANLKELFLKVDYVGDVARLSMGGKLLDDNFYNGLPWTVGLSRFLSGPGPGKLQLSILPLRKDAPIFLEPRYRPDFGRQSQTDRLLRIQLIPQYELTINSTATRRDK
jgi:hypothetical protein